MMCDAPAVTDRRCITQLVGRKVLQVFRHGLGQVSGDQLESVILFGSQAGGEAQPGSDVDILVVVHVPFNYGDLIRRTRVCFV